MHIMRIFSINIVRWDHNSHLVFHVGSNPWQLLKDELVRHRVVLQSLIQVGAISGCHIVDGADVLDDGPVRWILVARRQKLVQLWDGDDVSLGNALCRD